MNMRAWSENLKCPRCQRDVHVFYAREYFVDLDEATKCPNCNQEMPEELMLQATDELTSTERTQFNKQLAADKANPPKEKKKEPGDEQAKNELYKEYKDQASRIGSDATEDIMDAVGIKGKDRPTVDQANDFIKRAKPVKGAGG